MIYTDEQLEMIEQFASIYLPITDIAVILEVTPEQLREDIHDSSNPAFQRYRKGKALSKVQLHQQEMTLAKVGSPLALQNARDNLLAMEDDE
jgi:DNA-binding transcriptional MerR regulator